ncbi:DNA repair protein RecN (Recombination protein N) [Thermoactinomyces sp. DSM 45891]|uniref:DNA repair protein RecN n=1 Tax=Thermoactinomyces sp. DSM 45891 TaxID=1761907 RepID=UPI000918C02B|nr:DNA repair protein RecN [Thermoactinomyces sp. DSM 45891]SFX52432.1 DNA repair protein RecN (Recombination protein N) [Thermoactinomyces sp. DSM 45891]
MIRQLSIRHFAIIEELHIDFSHGFHALTGETGAGKSILIDALGLVVGDRASADFVRHGQEKAEIEAVFDCEPNEQLTSLFEEQGLELEEGSVWIRREVLANGKSSCRVNGRLVTLGVLKQIGTHLIDIHGQHESQKLNQIDMHLDWIDQYGGPELLTIRADYQENYENYIQIERKLAKLNQDERELVQRIDLLEYQLEEIRDTQLILGEDEVLETECRKLANTEKLMAHVNHSYQCLYGEQRGLDFLHKASSELASVADLDPKLQELQEQLLSVTDHLDDMIRDLSHYQDTLDFDPKRLAEAQERAHHIGQLKRKYGETIPDIMKYEELISSELSELLDRDIHRDDLEKHRDLYKERLFILASHITKLRKKAARNLEVEMERELADLHMGSTVFRVHFNDGDGSQQRLTRTGQDEVEFQIAPNVGEPLRPLAKIASGGEMSRIMLSLTCIFADITQVDTLIFDEVDTGVSGRAAQAIAEKIAYIAGRCQVLCVTHLPQVACMADYHYGISKQSSDSVIRTTVDPLDHSARVLELARMLGGAEVTNKTKDHATEMIRLANMVKEKIKQMAGSF